MYFTWFWKHVLQGLCDLVVNVIQIPFSLFRKLSLEREREYEKYRSMWKYNKFDLLFDKRERREK